jgi:hypothetical protein
MDLGGGRHIFWIDAILGSLVRGGSLLSGTFVEVLVMVESGDSKMAVQHVNAASSPLVLCCTPR